MRSLPALLPVLFLLSAVIARADEAPRAVTPGTNGGPPSDAIVLFDGTNLDAFVKQRDRSKPAEWEVKDGLLTVNGTGDISTKESFGDIQLHLEWRAPEEDGGRTGESRGNSGIKFHEAYEIQILDSHGVTEGRFTGQAAAIYKQNAPYVNACLPAGEWQTYDIVFRAPHFDAAGQLVRRGTFTVFHNGVLAQDDEVVEGRTNSNVPARPEYEQPFFLQDHGSRVSYRNIWVRRLERKPFGQGRAPRRVLAADYSEGRRHLLMIDEDGRVSFRHPIRNLHDVHVLPSGNILFQTDWNDVVEATPAGRVVWKYDARKNVPEGQRVEIHAFQRLENGLTMIAESGPARIIEVDEDGTIQKEIRLEVENPNAHSDTRNARKLAGGHYLVAHEADAKVREYDGEGKVVWEYDAKGRIYSAIRLESGNTLIGGGDLHAVIEVNAQGEEVWRVGENDLPGIRLAWITQVERLPSGNTRFINCHAGPDQPQIIEVTPAKKVVWAFHDWTHFGNALPAAVVLGD